MDRPRARNGDRLAETAMADLRVNLCGVHLRNPLVLASGPLSWNAEAIRAAFAAGAAAVVTKTIRQEPTVNPVPHIARSGRRSLLNTEGWSDLSAQRWIDQELPSLATRDGVLIASTGHTPGEVACLAGPLAGTGVDMLELVSYEASEAAPMVAEAKRLVTIPVLVKVSANWAGLRDVVATCVKAGADGFTAIDSIGPVLEIDVETGRPRPGSRAWLSGQAIHPIAVQAVADICLHHSVPVVGTGGVVRPEDAVEMVMVGATAVGAHTAPLLQGLDWFGATLASLEGWLDERGIRQLSRLRGSALPSLQQDGPPVLSFAFDPDACSQCGRCVTVCAYRARNLRPGRMLLDRSLCRWCGLCVSVCPTGALRFN